MNIGSIFGTPKKNGQYEMPWVGILRRIGQFCFLIVVVAPLFVLIAGSLEAVILGQSDRISLALLSGRRFNLLQASILLAAAVSVGGTCIGIMAGSILWTWNRGPRKFLRWFIWVLVPVPAYVHALAWSTAVTALNPWFLSLGLPPIPFQGFFASWWVQMMTLAPLSAGLTLIGLVSIDPALIEAGRIIRSDLHTFFKVMLPAAKPIIYTSAGFLFIFSLMDYSVPTLFQTNTYALEIFAEFSASNDPVRTLVVAIPQLVISVLILLLIQSGLRHFAQRPNWRGQRGRITLVWTAWFAWMQRIIMLLLTAQIVVPTVSLASAVGTLNNLVSSLESAGSELRLSVFIGITGAAVSIPIALAAADRLVKRQRGAHAWWMLVVIPLAIPSSLVGVGLISLWNRVLPVAVYGTELMPILAVLARFTPLAVLVLVAQLRRIDPALLDAGRVLQTRSWHTTGKILLPLLGAGLVAATCLVFVVSMGELGATLLVVPPGGATLTLRIYNYLHYGASDVVAGLCLMMVLTTLLIGLLAVISMGRAAFTRKICRLSNG